MSHGAELKAAVDELIEAKTNGIESVRQLAKRLQELAPRASDEIWRRTLTRYFADETVPGKNFYVLLAKAFAVDVSTFPPRPKQPTLRQLEDRLERLEGNVLVLPPPVDPETLAALVRLLPDAAGQLERILKAQQPPAENESR